MTMPPDEGEERSLLERLFVPSAAGDGGRDLAWYLDAGWRGGRDPNPWFSAAYYVAGLAGLDAAPLLHYVRHGAAEGRAPHPWFDAGWYARRHLDRRGGDAGVLAHFLEQGLEAGDVPHPALDRAPVRDRVMAAAPGARGGAGDRPLVTQASQGALDATGLAPERHLDRRRGGRQQAANFRRDIGRIGFSGPAVDYPAWPGAQDRLSWLAQLAAILGAGHAAPEVQLFVVDARGAGSLWRLQRLPDERLSTPMGEVLAQLWQRDPPRPEGLLVQAWLDANRGHWPVQLRFTAQRSGDVFELRLLAEPQPPP